MSNTIRCPHCGQPLKPRTYEILGEKKKVGHEDCQCAGARHAREVHARLEEQREAQQREMELVQELTRSGVMPRYLKAEHHLADELAREAMDGRNVYIHGDVGTSKTHLASAIARILVQQGRAVRFTSMWRILDEIKAGYKTGNDPLPRYQTARILILDDLGKESPTDYAMERLFALVDERSARMLPTIVTSQYRPSQMVERLAKRGDADTAKAIVSRLRQGCRMVELTGRDLRLDDGLA